MSSSSSTVASLQAKLGEIQKERQILEKKLSHARGGSGGSGGGWGRSNRQVILDEAGAGGGGGGGGSRRGGASDGTMYPRHGRPTSPRRDGGLLSRVGEKRGRLASAVSVPGGEEKGEIEEGEVPDQEGGRARKTLRRDGENGGRGGRGRGPAVATVVVDPARQAALKAMRDEAYEAAELRAEERGEMKNIYQKEEVKKRDRRMFGVLMGHLGAAQARLKKDGEGSGILRKQRGVMEVVVGKDREEAERRKVKEEEEREKRRRGEERRREWLAVRQKKVEGELDCARYREYWGAFKGFILTRVEPKLFWLPARMNEAMTEKLEESRREGEEKVRRREEERAEEGRKAELAFTEKWGPAGREEEEEDGGGGKEREDATVLSAGVEDESSSVGNGDGNGDGGAGEEGEGYGKGEVVVEEKKKGERGEEEKDEMVDEKRRKERDEEEGEEEEEGGSPNDAMVRRSGEEEEEEEQEEKNNDSDEGKKKNEETRERRGRRSSRRE